MDSFVAGWVTFEAMQEALGLPDHEGMLLANHWNSHVLRGYWRRRSGIHEIFMMPFRTAGRYLLRDARPSDFVVG